MPKKESRPGRELLYAEIEETLAARFKEARKRYRHSLVSALELAIELYMRANWPMPTDPPPTELPQPLPKRPRGRPRKQS